MAINSGPIPILLSGAATHTSLGDASSGHQGSITFQLVNVSGTFTPEGSVDETNYVTVGIVNMLAPLTIVSTITADGIYKVDMYGLRKFRLSHPGSATGTATLTFMPLLA
jgi:hypothetical protein